MNPLRRFATVAMVALMLASLALPGNTASAETIFNYNYTGALQTFIAPITGTYHVTARGAAGGNGYGSNAGGLGAIASGDVFLTAGDILSVIVGGVGTTNTGLYPWGGGGGGGSFVYFGSTALLVAGGGGGGGFASGGTSSTGLGGTGLGGLGTVGVGDGYGGGGAGFLGDGGQATQFNGISYGGSSAANGLGGGLGSSGGNGGFGGGGSAGFASGGGGGGYTGGNGGIETGPGQAFGGDAGTSYFDNTVVSNFVLTGGVNAGDGSLTITAVPEPSTYAMALAGVACGGFSMWRRRKRA